MCIAASLHRAHLQRPREGEHNPHVDAGTALASLAFSNFGSECKSLSPQFCFLTAAPPPLLFLSRRPQGGLGITSNNGFWCCAITCSLQSLSLLSLLDPFRHHLPADPGASKLTTSPLNTAPSHRSPPQPHLQLRRMSSSAQSQQGNLDRYVVIHVATTCDEHGVYVTKDSAEVIELGWILLDAKSCEEVYFT